MKPLITIETPPYKPRGRYVCDHTVTEAHLFGNLPDALRFARAWRRNCNVGWLAPTCSNGRNLEPTEREAQLQISRHVAIFDHRS